MNMSIGPANFAQQFFPSLSQTPKFEDMGQRSFKQLQQLRQQNRLRSMQGSRTRLVQQKDQDNQVVHATKQLERRIASSPQPYNNAWEEGQINQFKIRNQNPQQVMEYLGEICKQDIKGKVGNKPGDFDSTEAVDSFLEALYVIVDDNILNYNDKCKEGMHLSTGARTEQCENFLSYLANLQQRNRVLIDSYEFFGIHMQQLKNLEIYKEQSDQVITQLKEEKEYLTMCRFDLEKKSDEMNQLLEESKKKEKDITQKLRLLNKKYENKKEECVSLSYRVKHMEDMSNMMEPPAYHQSIVSEANGESDPASDNIERSTTQKVQSLESLNKKLEIELSLVKAILQKQSEQQEDKFNGNVDHFVRIQDLFNKAQIENKCLRSTNGKLESQLESKQRLIGHLEDKVTQVMLEKEDIIVKLKSEIIILKSQNDQSESKIDQKVNKNKDVFEKQMQAQYNEQIQGLNNLLEIGKKEKDEHMKRIDDLQRQYQEIDSEFNIFRDQKEEQEKEREGYLQEVENKLSSINGHYEAMLQKLQDKIDELENQNQVFEKSNNILDMKLGYLKDSTYTLLKQKQFMKEDVEKSWANIQNSFTTLTQTMFEANSNKDYLISVKKAAKQTQTMMDMGLQSLNNVLQILNFFKIEELFTMLSQKDSADFNTHPDNSNFEIFVKQMHKIKEEDTIEMKQRFTSKRSSEKTHIDPVHGLKIQNYLNINKKTPQDQDNNDQLDNSLNEQYQIDRNEEYYFHHCSLEMSSILLKMIADILLLLGACSEFDSLPPKFSNLLDLANEKTDTYIEQEIFARYLIDAKKLIESKVAEGGEIQNQQAQQIQQIAQELKIVMQNQNNNLANTTGRNHLQVLQQSEEDMISGSGGEEDSNINLSPSKMVQRKSMVPPSTQPRISISNGSAQQQQKLSHMLSPPGMDMLNLQVQDQAQLDQRRKDQRHKSVFVNATSPSPRQQQSKHQSKSPKKKVSTNNGGGHSHNKETAVQLEQLKVELQENKLKSKSLQLQLATKIVILEEQLENAQSQREKDIVELEEVRKQEVEKTKVGIQQRENQLLLNLSEQKERIAHLEKQIQDLNNSLEQKLYQLQAVEKERSEFTQKIDLKEQELGIFKNNVSDYVNIKTSNRNTFGLAFEINQSNQSMINEAMVKYYLNKCLDIDKSKFRFITSDAEDFQIENKSKHNNSTLNSHDAITVAKIIIEIIDDEKNVQTYFQKMKQQIRDGSSILYDLGALYFSMNLGFFGIKGQNNLNEYHLISRKGQCLGNKEFIITILRHKTNPLQLKILAINYSSGEEYHLDLQQEDILELLEGQSLQLVSTLGLEEPSSELIESILANLKLVSKDDITILVCEHKIFFNNLFHCMITPNLKKNQEAVMNQSKRNNGTDTVLRTLDIKDEQNLFSNTSYRNKQIMGTQKDKEKENSSYSNSLAVEKDCQTDFEVALMHDNFKQMYLGNQRVGKKLEFKISILNGQKNNSMQVIIEEIKSKKKMQVCFIENKTVDEELPCEYIIYTHCMEIKGSHMVLVSLEKVLGDGLFIKIHDLKELQTEEFFLIKKSAGHYSKLNRAQGGMFIIKEDFRNLIYDLTFSYSTSIPSSQVLLSNVTYHKEVHSLKNPNQDDYDINKQLLVLPFRQRNGQVMVQQAPFEVQHLKLLAKTNHMGKQESSLLAPITDKGLLLYRNTFVVRCSFEGAQESEQDSLISFYQKKDEISVEVFLYKDTQKMSIASQVNASDLFGIDYHGLSFSQKVEMLDQMMEKLYVLSESQSYHLKVENEAVPISEVIEGKRKGVNEDTNVLAQGYNKSLLLDRIKDIQSNRQEHLSADKASMFQSYIVIQNHFYEYKVYFMIKYDKDNSDNKISPKKNKSFTRRGTMDRQISNVEEYIEDTIDFDQIYIELTDKDQELYSTLLNQKSLAELLMKNKENLSFRQAFARNKQSLTEFLVQLISIDKESGLVIIDNSRTAKQNFLMKYQEMVEGAYIKKTSFYQNLDQQSEEQDSMHLFQKELVIKRLILNQEVEMCEFIYDIKIFENILKQNNQVLSYSLELFSLNDPETLYNFNYPIEKDRQQSTNKYSMETPFYMGIDLINLIEHPFKEDSSKLMADTVTIESSLKKNFQNLFSKYIDNNLMIIVQGQAFPFSINFSIVEPNSKLQWSYLLPIQECSSDLSSSIGKLSVIDQALIEQYIVLVLNEKQMKDKQFKLNIVEEKIVNDDRAARVLDIDNDIDFQMSLCTKNVLEDLKVSLYKQDSSFILQINISSPDIPVNKNSPINQSQDINKSQQTQNYQYRIDMEGHNEKLFSKLLYLKRSQNKEQNLHNAHTLMIILDIKEEQLSLKIIDLSTQNVSSQVLYQFVTNCCYQEQKSASSIAGQQSFNEDASHNYRSKGLQQLNKNKYASDQNHNHQLEQTNSFQEANSFDKAEVTPTKMVIPFKQNSTQAIREPVKTIQRNESALCEAFIIGLKQFYSQQFVDLICQTQSELLVEDTRVYNQSTGEYYSNSDEFKEYFSAKVKRLQLMIKQNNKEMVLHRKTYFDEGSEKLIIVLVSIETSGVAINQMQKNSQEKHESKEKSKVHPSRKQLELENEINKFKVVICEPENNKTNEFVLSLDQCFLEEEIMSINKKNIIQLKKIAKILVEERTVIKRANGEGNNGNSYAIEISLNHLIPSSYDNHNAHSAFQDQDDTENGLMQKYKLGTNSQIITGSGIVGSQNIIKMDRQRLAEEIMELDEEDEEDSIKKDGERISRGLRQQAIIEEGESQEEDHSPEELRPNKRNNNQANNNENSEILISENNIHSQQNFNEDIDHDVLRKFQEQEHDISEGQMDEQSEQADEQDESQMSIVFMKQVSNDQILEIYEVHPPSNKTQEDNWEKRYIFRRKGVVDNTVIDDRILNEEEIRQVTGFAGDLMKDGAKEEMLGMIADIIMEQS